MAAIISRCNKTLLAHRTKPAKTVSPCNCRAKASCPMKGLSCIIYKATLTSDGIAKKYYGCSKTEFKTRFSAITIALTIGKSAIPSGCLKLFGKLKTQEKNPLLNAASRPASHHIIRELRCLAEKLFILRADTTNMLNKRSKLNGEMPF